MADHSLSRIITIVAALTAAVPGAADSLGDYARRHPLASSAAPGDSLLIDNQTVATLAGRGWLTTARPDLGEVAGHPGEAEPSAPERADEERKRSSWRRQHQRQTERVVALCEQIRALDDEIAELDRARFAAGLSRRAASLAGRLEVLQRKRQQAAARLERERAKLAAVVRQARRDGAQPGWFR